MRDREPADQRYAVAPAKVSGGFPGGRRQLEIAALCGGQVEVGLRLFEMSRRGVGRSEARSELSLRSIAPGAFEYGQAACNIDPHLFFPSPVWLVAVFLPRYYGYSQVTCHPCGGGADFQLPPDKSSIVFLLFKGALDGSADGLGGLWGTATGAGGPNLSAGMAGALDKFWAPGDTAGFRVS